jgi:uncharacterized alkaline shock family protein YloU
MLGLTVGNDNLDNTAKASATVSADTTVLDVRLSIAYPASVGKTTAAVRRHLVGRVRELTGLTVSRVDITVTALPGVAGESRRVQ